MKFKHSLYMMTTVAALTLAACSEQGKDKSAASASGATGNVIKIASVSPLSGASAVDGKDNQSGSLLAVEDINAAGGVEIAGKKYTLELVSEDDGADPKTGGIVAQKIVDDKSISAVVGHYNSGVTMVANPIYAKDDLVDITPAASNPDVIGRAPKTASGKTSIYRMIAHDGQQGPALAAYAQKIGIKSIAILDDATQYGKGMADQVDKKAKEIGLTVVSHDALTDKTTDFKPVLTKIKGEIPDAVMWGGLTDTGATLAKQMRELGLKSKILMPDAVCTDKFLELSGEAGQGVYCAYTGVPLSEMKDGLAFKARFEKRFAGQPMQGFAPFAYDAVYVLIEAMKKAGSTERGKIVDAMPGISYTGVSGPISFLDSGERKDSAITIFESKGRDWVVVDKIK